MDQEKRKNYNKNYYENHKVVLLEKLTKKVSCEFCNRQVSQCNLNKHYTLSICQRTQDKNKYILQRQNN
jgi:hypothetical protein